MPQSIGCKGGFLTTNNHGDNGVAVVIVFRGVLRVPFCVTAALLLVLSPPASFCGGQLWLGMYGGRGLT